MSSNRRRLSSLPRFPGRLNYFKNFTLTSLSVNPKVTLIDEPQLEMINFLRERIRIRLSHLSLIRERFKGYRCESGMQL